MADDTHTEPGTFTCRHCLGVVPDGASRCRHCGSELSATAPWWRLAFIVALVLLILYLFAAYALG